jgi:hypothetical protein
LRKKRWEEVEEEEEKKEEEEEEKEEEEEEEVFRFVMFCYVSPKYLRLLNCFDFFKILFCFVLNF